MVTGRSRDNRLHQVPTRTTNKKKLVGRLTHLCRDIVAPFIAIHRVPRVNIRISDAAHGIWWQTVHNMICKRIGRLPKNFINLGRDGVTHGTISFSCIGGHFNRYHTVSNVGILAGGIHPVFIGYLVEVELIMSKTEVEIK